MMYENNLLTAVINISSSGDNTIIAAPSAGYIAIDHINFIPTSAVTITLNDGTNEPAYPLDSKQAFTIENAILNPKGIITVDPETAFIINLSAAVQVGGFIRYRIVI